MQANLIVVGGVHSGRKIPLHVAEFLIGRDASCHLRPSSKDVEPQHCAILSRNQALYLRDAGHGTRCDGRLLIGGELQLRDGDTLEVGPLAFRLAIDAAVILSVEKVDAQEFLVPTAHDTVHRAGAAPGGEQSPDETAIIDMPSAPPVPTGPLEDSNEIICLP